MKTILNRLFITYLKKNEEIGLVYAGRASGETTGNQEKDAEEIRKKRDNSHHKNQEGYGESEIDEISTNSDAIRGREQMLIEYLQKKGICGNQRNGISETNDKKEQYLEAAKNEFGEIEEETKE